MEGGDRVRASPQGRIAVVSPRPMTDPAIRWLSFDRAQKKNAFTGEMYTRCAQTLTQANGDGQVKVCVLTGSGGAFTAGNDLADFFERPPTDFSAPVFQFLQALASFEKPLLAAVEGPAIGIGTTMLLHCDYVVAADTAKFALPFVNLGLCPEGASSLLLPQMAGWSLACELLLFGEPFDGATAVRAGIAAKVVPADQLQTTITERAQTLAKKPLASLIATKRLLRKSSRSDVDAVLKAEGTVFLERLGSPEAKAALTAFLERRAPSRP
jgi:enoyl-CoA hydratase/carnithine racemase